MDPSGINLMAYTRTEPGTPEGGPPAYDNPGFELPADKEASASASVSSNDMDDTTAANTYANAARPGGKVINNVDDAPTSEDEKKPTTTAAATTTDTSGSTAAAGTTTTGFRKGSNTPITPPTRHKDSTVGFRLPEVTQPRERRKSSSSCAPKDQPYRGMGKEDLLRHSGKPFWRRLRYICMSVVMVGWLALIITVVTLVLVYPRCRTPPEQGWWKKAVIYRIYVRSFQDHDGDGIGDLDGISSRLRYLRELGITTISLSPIYPVSPTAEGDTEIIDHKDIAPEYGNIAQFVSMVNASHAHGINVVLDFIPNHTGLDHQWFKESQNSSLHTNLKRNYYVWENGQGSNLLEPPNNWRSVYNEPAWTSAFNKRGQYYLHQFSKTQPDLNLRSSEVKDHLKDILKFWMQLGVDGFYIRDSGFLFEDYDIRYAELLTNDSDPDLYSSYDHTYTYGRSEVHDMFARWRAFLDDYGNQTGRYRLMFADREGDIKDLMDYYGHFNRDGVNFPLNTHCLKLNHSTSGHDVAALVRQWMSSMPSTRWANWLGGTDKSKRMIDRLGESLMRPFLTLIMLLPGTPVFYYGDEIGMSGFLELNVTEVDQGQSNLSMRSPMQWDNTSNAGFCRCTKFPPWMKPNPQYSTVNVEKQRADAYSTYHLFSNLTSLRASYSSFHFGDYNEAVVDDDVFSFVRDFDGEKGFLVALNFANTTVTRDYQGTYYTIPSDATVSLRTGPGVPYKKGDKVSTSGVQIGPHEGVVLSWDYVAKEL